MAEAAWLGLVLVVPLVMNVAAARTFEAAKLAAAAPLAALLLFALIAAAVEGQASVPHMVRRQPGFWAFVALIASAITATALSETPWIAFFGDYFRREGMVSWLIYATVFAALISLMRQRDQLERLLDALLLASVVPCVYALQQRYGYDFFSTAGLGGGTAGARPGSNLGNPTFLSAYLLLIIPLTIARVVGTAGSWGTRAPWLFLLGLQLFAAILTQSRGPLLGLGGTLFLMAIVLGGQLKMRGLIFAAVGAGALTIAGLLLLNLMTDLQGIVKNTPLQRFVFTGGHDYSSNSRIGIWSMGVDAFLHLPTWRQWIGAGADASHFNYFPHLPSWVLRIEGLSETIDRLHSESLETLMTFGLAGLAAQLVLMSSLVWLAVRRLGQIEGAKPALVFAIACILASAGTGFAFKSIGGVRALFAIGAGLGIAIAWSGALLLASWRALGSSNRPLGRADAALLAALACALIGSWIEAQVGVPTISTRLLTAVYAALILLVGTQSFNRSQIAPAAAESPQPAARNSPRKHKKTRVHNPARPAAASRISRPAMAGWATGLALMVATAAYFPPLSGSTIHPPSPQRLHLIIVPLLALVIAGAVFAWNEARRTDAAPMDALTKFLLWMSVPWFTFMLGYAQIGGAIAGAGDAQVGDRINSLLMFAFGAYPVAVIALGLGWFWSDAGAGSTTRSRPLALALLASGALACAAAYYAAMIDVRADTFAKLANWAQAQNRHEVATVFFKTAAELLPEERRFTGSYAARLIERSAQDLSSLPQKPELAKAILERLAIAQKTIEQAQRAAPRDPWVTFSHANVHQFQGIGLLDTYQTRGEKANHIELARKYFELARTQFPGHPWILRNWAQMDVDLGDRAAAYRKFDEMELLDPQNIGNYSERLRFTRAFGDHAIAIEALRRGIAAQQVGSSGEAELKLELARYFQQIGQPQQALNLWSEILARQPDNFAVASDVAEAYAQLGQRDLALGNAQAALTRIATMPRSAQTDAARARLESVVARLAARPGTR
jgi:tetratricopeptide (TPR) repeat protein